MAHFMNKYRYQSHGLEQQGVPEKEVGEEVAAQEGDEYYFFVAATTIEGPVGVRARRRRRCIVEQVLP